MMTIRKGVAPRVSVLVPIYNAEKYLAQCLGGLISQTLKEIEFICINDGSTDNSLSILHEYASRDDRFVVVDKDNSGYGASMNRGLDEAQGEYIGIVEADDFCSRDMFEKLHKTAVRYDCDLVKSNYFEHLNGKDHIIRFLEGFSYQEVFDPVEKPQIITTIPSIWTSLYRRSMLEQHSIRFRETPGASFQDTSFVLKVWFVAQRCVLLRKPFLHYRIDNPNSSVKTSDKVFVVCDELSESERFLKALPERARSFLPWLHVDKLGKYRWNYERISAEAKPSFALRMHDEYAQAFANGELKIELFVPSDQIIVQSIIESTPEEFVKAHPEDF